MKPLLAPCSKKAAEYAVQHWHYSQRMPSGKLFIRGVWENEKYIGAVLFGRGANDRMLKPYGLKQSQGCELVRVALTEHESPVSQIVAEALRQLKEANPGLRLVISYADPEQSHHGGIYQAGNWIYHGMTAGSFEYVVKGKRIHERSISAARRTAMSNPRTCPIKGEPRIDWVRRVLDPRAERVRAEPKHRYIMPLDRAMRRRVSKAALPYPPPAVEGSEETRLAYQ